MNIKVNNLFKKKEPSVLLELLSSPDGNTYTMEVEDGEIVIRIKKKEMKNEEWKSLYLCNSILNRNNCRNEHDERTEDLTLVLLFFAFITITIIERR